MNDLNEFTIPIIVSSTVSAAAVTNPKLSFPYTVDILGVSLNIGTAPTGAALIVQLVNDGSNAYTSSGTDKRPTIAISGTAGTAVAPDLYPSLVAGKVLTATVAQVGSSVAGADLTINVHLRKR